MNRILSLLAICLFVCSCNKNDAPQFFLIGSWDVTLIQTTVVKTVANEDSQTTIEYPNMYNYTFLENGHGIRVANEGSFRSEFDYYYDKGNNAIVFTYNGTKDETTLAKIESLTKNSFVFHSSGTRRSGSISYKYETTWKGKKLE